jgi:hypothetical protein
LKISGKTLSTARRNSTALNLQTLTVGCYFNYDLVLYISVVFVRV